MLTTPRIAASLAATLLTLAPGARAQDSTDATEPDWAEVVQTAVEHPRYAVRRAATGKLAKAGDAAVPAIRAFLDEHGRNAVPLLVVDAIARHPEQDGPETLALLGEWAIDREFYWRSQALGGLARRGHVEHLPLFRGALDDPSHLQRIEGVRGLLTLDPGLADTVGEPPDEDAKREVPETVLLAQRTLRAEDDPRARLRMALLLLQANYWIGIEAILDAVDNADAVWLDDPWGAREATFAVRELDRLGCGDFRDAIAAQPEARAAGRASLYAWALRQGHAYQPKQAIESAAASPWVGGVEVRSCRNGDLYLRWAADGRVLAGLVGEKPVQLDAAAFGALRAELRRGAGSAVHGKVICDFVRLLDPVDAEAEGRVHRKCAPGAVPAAMLSWLDELQRLLAEAGTQDADAADLAQQLAERLPQFASR